SPAGRTRIRRAQPVNGVGFFRLAVLADDSKRGIEHAVQIDPYRSFFPTLEFLVGTDEHVVAIEATELRVVIQVHEIAGTSRGPFTLKQLASVQLHIHFFDGSNIGDLLDDLSDRIVVADRAGSAGILLRPFHERQPEEMESLAPDNGNDVIAVDLC